MLIVYKYKDKEVEFTPLENGRAEYLVSLHDYGNLESLINIRCKYDVLVYLIDNISNPYILNYLKGI